jgi:hypothetical protein
MAIVLGNGAIRIWVGERQQAGRRTANIGVLIHERRLPPGVTLDGVKTRLQVEIEQLLRTLYPWCR